MYWCKFFILFICLITLESALGMSRPQLKKTLSLMKKSCVQKNGVAEDKIANIEEGVFVAERSVMCYITCIYQSVQVIKNNRLDKDLVAKQVDALFPNDMKDAVKSAAEKCVNVQNAYSDMCEGVFYAVKCLYETEPSNFVFP